MRFQETFPIPGQWYDDTDELLVESIYGWAERYVISRRTEHGEDRDGLLRPATEALLDDVGLRGLVVDGESADVSTRLSLALEQVGRADVGIAFLLTNSFTVDATLRRHGKSSLSSVSGPESSIESLSALVLPDYGPQSAAFRGLRAPAKAELRGGSLVLDSHGAVRPQCSGVDARAFGVACELDGQPALVLVPSGASGLRRGEKLVKTGLAASETCDLVLDGVELSRDHLVFEGEAHYQAMVSGYYLAIAAAFTGAMLAAWQILYDWGETRVIKGKGQVFRENPLVAHLMGRIGGDIGTSRLLVLSLAGVLREADEAKAMSLHATALSVLTKVAEAATGCLDAVMELMASAGYAKEWNLERYWRDAKTVQTCMGPAAAQTDTARHYFGCEKL